MNKRLITAFPFYSKIEMQNRYRENNSNNCDYELICTKDAFLPFQILVTENVTIKKIELCTSNLNKTDITENKDAIQVIKKDAGVYFQYNGEPLKFNEKPLRMDHAKRWLEITFTNDKKVYSERFSPKDFKVNEASEYLKLTYRSDGDLEPIMYSQAFKQVVYLNSFIHTNEPEIEEEVKENSKGQTIPLTQKMITNHKIVDLVPDFMKLAITSLQLHNDIKIELPYGIDEITAERVTTTSSPTVDGAYSNVEISVKQILLSLNACNSLIN